jgi:phospholipid-translocating ATPase
MVIAAVVVVNAFHGISTSAWTSWVWFAITIGVILIWLYTVSYMSTHFWWTLSEPIFLGRLLRHTAF